MLFKRIFPAVLWPPHNEAKGGLTGHPYTITNVYI